MGNFTNKLTEEELKALLKELPEENKDKQDLLEQTNNDVLDFLSFYGLEAGSHLIPIRLIYTLYHKWSKNPLINIPFAKEISLYLARDKTNVYYLINQDVLKINKHLYNFLNKKPKSKIKDYRPHFQKFLDHYNIKKGSLWLPKEVFTYLYDLWTFNKKPVLGKLHITGLCNLCLPIKKDKNNIQLYGVDKMILKHITQKQIEEIKEGVLFRGKKKKRKENK